MLVTELNLYPIKSTQAYSVKQAFVLPQGLHFDREFMLTEVDGTFITARKEKVLYQIAAFPISTGIILTFQGEQCVARYVDFTHQQQCEVWGSYFQSWIADESVNHWLSQIFQRPVQLRWLGEKSERKLPYFEANPLSFADSNPILLCNQKSLAQVQEWSPISVEMARFRANIVIDGERAFEEEQWQEIQIGEVYFEFVQHCTRCIMITRDPMTVELDQKAEPFRTLKKHHTNEKGQPIFGIHLVPRNSGIIRVGDKLSVISKR